MAFSRTRRLGRKEKSTFQKHTLMESLEGRLFLSAAKLSKSAPVIAPPAPPVLKMSIGSQTAKPIAVLEKVSHTATSVPSSAITPSEMTSAYGVSEITFGSVAGDGAGQTIAIIDAYNDPDAANDLQQFDLQFGLPNPPSFQVLNQNGVAGDYPTTDPAGPGNSSGTWELEESLDIEWAHAIAPDANIDLIEANSPSDSNLIQTAVNTARNLPGVDVVSMSFSTPETKNETTYDKYFTTPLGHPGVTFLAATGDDGAPGGYPAYSPNVVAVGGTTLNLNGSTYGSETAWNDSGGGISQVESQPKYQQGVVTQSSTARTIPDVSIDANPNTGVAVYDSYDYPNSPWIQVGGTSLATPMWAGLIAVADQGREMASLGSLDGATQTLPALYQLPESDFNDITSGNNGFAAGVGYDLVTGRGSPIANVLVPALAGVQSISGTVFQDNNGDGVLDAGDTPIAGATVYLDANDNGMLDPTTTTNFSSTNVPLTISGGSTVTSSLTVSGTTAPITNISLTLNITESHDSNLTAYLIGPDGTTVTLFAAVGGTAANFTGTTFSGSAATSIASGTAPFSGTFTPSPGELYEFNNKSANGTWKLEIVDSARSDSASLTGWSLAVTTGEISTTTDAQGEFVFNSVPIGTYNLREVPPAGEVQIPSPSTDVLTVGPSAVSGQNFANFPTILNDPTDGDTYYLELDPTGTDVQIFNSNLPAGTATYQVALADLPSLTFNLSGANETLTVDYSNGDPIPPGGLTLNGDAAGTGSLYIIGQTPSQVISVNDTQITVAGGGTINYTPLGTLGFYGATVQYSGDFSTIQNLDLDGDTTFIVE
jgi:subtilisin-like proprotein convertase family protein